MSFKLQSLTEFTGKSYSMMIIFSILDDHKPLTGYSLLKKIEEKSQNEISFSAGAIYPQIEEYVELGLLIRKLENKISKSSGRSREIALFSLSDQGKQILKYLKVEWLRLINLTNKIVEK